MRQRITLDERSVPRLPRHIRLHRDGSRTYQLEELLVPEPLVAEVLRRCDGRASVGSIVDEVSAVLEAPRAEVAAGVTNLLQGLADVGFLVA